MPDKVIPVGHPIWDDLMYSKREDRDSERTANLERVLMGARYEFSLLPANWQSVITREMSALVLKGIRDGANVCPMHEHDEEECTCEHFDHAMDALVDTTNSDPLYLYFQDDPDLEELRTLIEIAGSASF